jgi:transcription elongation GreA/GreB family factor
MERSTIKSSIAFKQRLFSACMALLDEKINGLYAALKDLTAGAETDSKSSAGDKHETSRAMMQLEHENISRQLDGLLKEKNKLTVIDAGSSMRITVGSLLRTNHGYIFLSVAIGKVTVDSEDVMTLSPQSPLGKKLLGHAAGDTVEMNGIQYIIKEAL